MLHIKRGLYRVRSPTVKALAKFKAVLFLNKDPQFCALGMCIVGVSCIEHIAYHHIQRNATRWALQGASTTDAPHEVH